MLGKTKLKHNLFLRRNQINYCNNHMRITWALISIHVIYETTYFTWLTWLRKRDDTSFLLQQTNERTSISHTAYFIGYVGWKPIPTTAQKHEMQSSYIIERMRPKQHSWLFYSWRQSFMTHIVLAYYFSYLSSWTKHILIIQYHELIFI